jgi:hypothetical protein
MKKIWPANDGSPYAWTAQSSHNIQHEFRIDWVQLLLSAAAVALFVAMVLMAAIVARG